MEWKTIWPINLKGSISTLLVLLALGACNPQSAEEKKQALIEALQEQKSSVDDQIEQAQKDIKKASREVKPELRKRVIQLKIDQFKLERSLKKTARTSSKEVEKWLEEVGGDIEGSIDEFADWLDKQAK